MGMSDALYRSPQLAELLRSVLDGSPVPDLSHVRFERVDAREALEHLPAADEAPGN
jgi:hypothetical protein